MRRRIANTLCALCALACVASAALWFRSHRRHDTGGYEGRWHKVTAVSLMGHTGIMFGRAENRPYSWQRGWRGGGFPFDHTSSYRDYHGTEPGALGFAYDDHGRSHLDGLDEDQLAFVIPHWFWVALFAMPPAMWLVKRRRRRRRESRGLCPGCGYDLRASPGRCPECGRDAIAAQRVA